MSPRDDLPGDDIPQDPTISRLYRELPDLAPSPDTDARLLAAARRAVGAGPRRGFVAAHWRGLGSAAAALLLGVGLTVQWRTQAPAQMEEALATAPAAAPTAAPGEDSIDALFADAPAPAAPPPAVAAQSGVEADAGAGESLARADTAVPAPARKLKPADALAQAEAQAQKQELARAREQTSARMSGEDQARELELAQRQEARIAPATAALPETMADRVASAPVAPAAPPPPLAGNVAGSAGAAGAMAPAAAAKAPAVPRARQERAEPGVADYPQLLAAGRYAEARQALATPATPDQIVDRDLLLQWLQPRHSPACATATGLGQLALLCEGLRRHAAGLPATASWRAELEASGLVSGRYAYRRDLVDKLFGAAVP